jgi:type IV secretory pathway TraG/TraD family ATPase VirD4
VREPLEPRHTLMCRLTRLWRGLCAILGSARQAMRSKGKGSASFLSPLQRWRLLSERHEGFLIDGVLRALSRKASFQSVLVVGGVGKGKTTGLCIPNLFHLHRASLVVIDTSGEVFEQTSGALAAQGRDIQVTESMSTVSNYPLNCITFRAGVRLPKGKLATLKAPRLVSKHPAKQAQARQVMGCGAKAYHITKPSEAMTERFPQRAQPDSSASS